MYSPAQTKTHTHGQSLLFIFFDNLLNSQIYLFKAIEATIENFHFKRFSSFREVKY